jgi:hypothetical protein
MSFIQNRPAVSSAEGVTDLRIHDLIYSRLAGLPWLEAGDHRNHQDDREFTGEQYAQLGEWKNPNAVEFTPYTNRIYNWTRSVPFSGDACSGGVSVNAGARSRFRRVLAFAAGVLLLSAIFVLSFWPPRAEIQQIAIPAIPVQPPPVQPPVVGSFSTAPVGTDPEPKVPLRIRSNTAGSVGGRKHKQARQRSLPDLRRPGVCRPSFPAAPAAARRSGASPHNGAGRSFNSYRTKAYSAFRAQPNAS